MATKLTQSPWFLNLLPKLVQPARLHCFLLVGVGGGEPTREQLMRHVAFVDLVPLVTDQDAVYAPAAVNAYLTVPGNDVVSTVTPLIFSVIDADPVNGGLVGVCALTVSVSPAAKVRPKSHPP